jgi:hypothetical protein
MSDPRQSPETPHPGISEPAVTPGGPGAPADVPVPGREHETVTPGREATPDVGVPSPGPERRVPGRPDGAPEIQPAREMPGAPGPSVPPVRGLGE